MGFLDALVSIGKSFAENAGKGIARASQKKSMFESYSDDRLVRMFWSRNGLDKAMAYSVLKGRYGEDTAKAMIRDGR